MLPKSFSVIRSSVGLIYYEAGTCEFASTTLCFGIIENETHLYLRFGDLHGYPINALQIQELKIY